MKIVLSEQQLRRIIQENIEELNYQSLQDDENLQVLRDAIDKNKLVSVAFVKKDGNVKHMLIRKSLSSYVGSDREKTDAQRNVEMNNDIKKVVDVNAYKREIKRLRGENPEMNDAEVKQMASKGAWRSISLGNVLGFMVGGNFIDLRDENEIMDRFGEQVYNQLTKSMVGAMQAQAPVNDNPEGEVNEGPGLLGSLIKTATRATIRGGSAISHHLGQFGASDLVVGLFQKAGKVSLNDYVINALKPAQNEFIVVLNDIKRLAPHVEPKSIARNPLTKMESHLKDPSNFGVFLSQQKNSIVDLGYVYKDLAEIKLWYLPQIEKEAIVKPAGKVILKDMKINLQDAITNLEKAMGQIITK
jgi:hypothetical protein